MTFPERPSATGWSPRPISGDNDDARLHGALRDIAKEDQWINEFIKRLNDVIEDAGHKNE